MKRKNKKLTTLILAGVCAASIGAATVGVVATADEAPTYKITDVFATSGTAATDKVSFALSNGEYVRYNRDLAFKWYTAKDTASYFNMQFSFSNLDFTSITFEMESEASVVNEEEKAVNAVEFKVVENALQAAVVNADTTNENKQFQAISYAAGETLTLSFLEGSAFDTFKVKLNDVTFTEEFTDIGANYGDYTYEEIHPLEITAALAADKETSVTIQSLNGQSFDASHVQGGQITDDTAPVLVVNEDVTTFQFGTAFSLSYEKVDVLQSTGLTENKKYYQWNPADEKVSYDNTLSSSVYFMDTVYYVDPSNPANVVKDKTSGFTATNVLKENGKEYISVKFTLTDDSNKSADYYLSWYASGVESKTLTEKTEGATPVATDYIVIEKNEEGAKYSYITLNDAEKKNEQDETAMESGVAAYQTLLRKAAASVSAGADSKISLPDVEWLIQDNGGYRALKFTISYRTPSTTTSPKSSTGLSYNGLKFTTSEEGDYEFKIFAVDKAGNAMKYYLDGKLVEVSTDNIWDIDEIPSFEFTIDDKEISVEDPSANNNSERLVEKVLDQTYTLSGLTVVGTTNEKSDYALYRFDNSKCPLVTDGMLYNVKYSAITAAARGKLDKVGTDYTSYFDLYLTEYATLLAKNESVYGDDATAAEIAQVKSCFTEIKEYNSKITESDPEWEAYNKYNWSVSSKSFTTVTEGNFIVFADYWEDGLFMNRAAAYKVISVESQADVIEGESEFSAWVQNNLVSVILFGVAGVLLIIIIILLFVKPSGESLEDVEKNEEKRKAKAKKAEK